MPSKLRNPREALGDYLDEMLHQATSEPRPAPPLERVLLPAQLLPLETVDEAEAAAAEVDAEPAPPVESGDPPAPAAASEADVNPDLDFPLQCLMFRVGEHRLAVPLLQLGSVVPWSESITRLPQSPAWLLGLIQVRESKLRVVDSGSLLQIAAVPQRPPEHLLVLGDSSWAMTCDRLEQVVNLDADDIQWKTGTGRAMRLGTIRESLATLISPPGIAADLDDRGRVAAD